MPPLFDIPEWWKRSGAPFMERVSSFFEPLAGGPSPFRPAPPRFRTPPRPTSPWQPQQFRGTAQTYLDLGLDPSEFQRRDRFGNPIRQTARDVVLGQLTRLAQEQGITDPDYLAQLETLGMDDLQAMLAGRVGREPLSPFERQRHLALIEQSQRTVQPTRWDWEIPGVPTLAESRAGEARILREFAGYPPWQVAAEGKRFGQAQFGYKEILEMGETIPGLKGLVERLEREWIEQGGLEASYAGIGGAVGGELVGRMTAATKAQRLPEFAGLKRKYQEEMHVEFPQIFPAYLDYQDAMSTRAGIPWTFNEWKANTPAVQAFLRLQEKEELEEKGRKTRAAELRHRPGRVAPIAQR